MENKRFILLTDALVITGLAKSKNDARRLIKQGAIEVNGRKIISSENDYCIYEDEMTSFLKKR